MTTATVGRETMPTFGKSPEERRCMSRIPCQSHAIIAGVTIDCHGQYGEDLVLEVSTKDVSTNGACIVAPQLLSVGQPVLFRMDMNSGCSISANGRVAYRGRRDPNGMNKKCDWGIEFDARDVEAFEQYGVFEEALMHQGASESEVAVLVSNHALELLWWLSRLPSTVRVVLVGSSDEQVIERMRKMAPDKSIRAMP